MIELNCVSKKFDDFTAVDNVSLTITEGNVFGLIGTNGAGKSTLMRMISGIYKPTEGQILIDGRPVFDVEDTKQLFYFIPDRPYFFSGATPLEVGKYLSSIYESFDNEVFGGYLEAFELGSKRKISTFSKGMKKQLALICGLSSNCKYLLCDETFDGLDPVMRQGVKSVFAKHMEERGLTPIIASHNLRELEDMCDHVGLLHKGGVLLSKDLLEMKCNIQKIQCVFTNEEDMKLVTDKLNIVSSEKRGQLLTMTVRASRDEADAVFKNSKALFFEILPLSLEEIFISETEVVGYDIKKLLLN